MSHDFLSCDPSNSSKMTGSRYNTVRRHGRAGGFQKSKAHCPNELFDRQGLACG